MEWNYSKTCVKQPLNRQYTKQIDKTKILMTNGSLMKVESIAECSPRSILQFFWPALDILKTNFRSLWKLPFYTDFTVHTLNNLEKIERTYNIRKQQTQFYWACSWELMESATILMPPITGLSGILLSVKTQYSWRTRIWKNINTIKVWMVHCIKYGGVTGYIFKNKIFHFFHWQSILSWQRVQFLMKCCLHRLPKCLFRDFQSAKG